MTQLARQPNLFPADDRAKHPPTAAPPAPDRTLLSRLRRSALWAAYGDALGFISELTDDSGLQRRTGGRPLDSTMEWTRRIGGRGGVIVNLPAGCYSDDTQLRLATGRSILGGNFDVETFAKVELPVFPSYALGAGVGTKAAASNLARQATPWFANTYKNWLSGGGNGAAMRIQPHVWAAHAQADKSSMMRDVLRNTVCTHAHPNAILGAVLHALCVDLAVGHHRVPTLADLEQFLLDAPGLIDVIEDDRDGLRNWKATWQSASGGPFPDAWQKAIREMQGCLELVSSLDASHDSFYRDVLDSLRLYKSDRRGSGAHTALAATLLSTRSQPPGQLLAEAAAELGSDTDTIGTMTGAIVGALAKGDPPGEVLDASLIVSEVDRLAGASQTDPREAVHHYPDLLRWSAPRTQADALTDDSGQMHVAGLGPVTEVLNEPIWSHDKKFAWQWVRLAIGQTLLVKRRPTLETLPPGNRIVRPLRRHETNRSTTPDHRGAAAGPATRPDHHQSELNDPAPIDIEDVLAWLERQGFDDASIGYAVRRMAVRGTTSQLTAFLAVLLARLGTPSR